MFGAEGLLALLALVQDQLQLDEAAERLMTWAMELALDSGSGAPQASTVKTGQSTELSIACHVMQLLRVDTCQRQLHL